MTDDSGKISPINWPADRVERRPIRDLAPYARNSRTHTSEQIDQLAASIREWGWTNPILVDEAGVIIAGHARVLAAERLGITDVPVMVAEGWTEAQVRAYVIADNKLALNAGWDEGMLRVEFEALDALGFDMDLTGFGPDEIGLLFDEPEPAAPGLSPKLSERFGFVPFSVLSAREGPWQDRKNAWLALGIRSEEGRGAAPGGSRQPAVDPKTGKIVRADSKGRPISGARTDAEADAMMRRAAG